MMNQGQLVDTTTPGSVSLKDKYDNSLVISYKDVTVTDYVPPSNGSSVKHNFFTPFIHDIPNLFRTKVPFHRIHKASGCIEPGQTYLVLGGPGCGRSTLLRALASKVQLDDSDSVRFNGYTAEELKQTNIGVDSRKLTAYAEQTDGALIAELTVEETLKFYTSMNFSNDEQLVMQRVNSIIEMVGLEEARHTIIGNNILKGTSGGQKRRVTNALTLCGHSRAIMLDQLSDGLDSKYAERILLSLRDWARQTGGSLVTSLNQPGKEIFEAFDNLILLRAGEVVYSGKIIDVLPYMASMGYHKPDDVETADWLISVVLNPQQVLAQQIVYQQHIARRQQQQKQQQSSSGNNNNNNSKSFVSIGRPNNNAKQTQTSLGPINVSPTPCITTIEMVEWFQQSPQYQLIQQQLEKYHQPLSSSNNDNNNNNNTCLDSKLFPLGPRLTIPQMLKHVVGRELKVLSRSSSMIIPRMTTGTIISILYGGMFYNIPESNFFMRVSGIASCLTQVAFQSMIALPQILDGNRVVKKDLSSSTYPAWAYCVGLLCRSWPLCFIEATLFGIIFYFMMGNVLDVNHFFVWWGILVLQSFLLDLLFKLLATVANTFEQANTLAQTFVSFASVLSGFFITRNSIPNWMVEFYWISPFSWGTRGLVLNEMKSSRYDQLVPYQDPKTGIILQERLGDIYLKNADIFVDEQWIWWTFLYTIAVGILLFSLQTFLLFIKAKWFQESRGSRRLPEQTFDQGDLDQILHDGAITLQNNNNNNNNSSDNNNNGSDNNNIDPVDIEIVADMNRNNNNNNNSINIPSRTAASSGGKKLKLTTIEQYFPAQPCWLSFQDITYTIKVNDPTTNTTKERLLLNGVSGFAQPGKVLALLGASGAGKTTLLNTLSLRTNFGVRGGTILLNGQEPTQELLASYCGFVEQFDNIFPYETVFDTLLFAARLRLSIHIPEHIKIKLVEELMELLDLTPLRDNLVGGAALPGLSQAELKKLNICLELVSNPSILFLDEPTSGLDAASATTVMHVIRRVATKLNKSIICTIHQPSSELIYLFDRLCLLAPGGIQLYFGNLGSRCTFFIDYFEKCPGIQPLDIGRNPASWLLDQSTGNNDLVQNIANYYRSSFIYNNVQKHLKLLSNIDIQQQQQEQQTIQDKQQQPQAIIEMVNQQQQYNDNNNNTYEVSQTTQHIPRSTTKVVQQEKASLWTQFWLLFLRNHSQYWRGTFTLSRMVNAIILSIVFGCLYNGASIPTTQAQMISRMSSFGVVIYFASTVATASLPIFECRAVFYRESDSGYYKRFMWATCTFLIEALWTVPYAFFAGIVLYWMNNGPALADKYFLYLLTSYTTILTYSSSTMWLCMMSPTLSASVSLMSAFLGMSFLFSSINITLSQMAIGWHWLVYLFPLQKAVNQLIQLFSNDTYSIIVVVDQIPTLQPARDFIGNYLGMSFGAARYWQCFAYLIAYIFVTQVFHHLSAIFLKFDKR